jgi:hypothetical protein
MHTCDDDLGTAPKMPEVGTRVRIREGEAAAVARQTLDSELRDSDMLHGLEAYLQSTTGRVSRASHTNGDVRVSMGGLSFLVFAYGAQVEPIE